MHHPASFLAEGLPVIRRDDEGRPVVEIQISQSLQEATDLVIHCGDLTVVEAEVL